MAQVNAQLNNYVWIIVLILLIGAGVLLTVRLRGFQFRRFGYILRHTVGNLFSARKNTCEGVTPFQAIATAMAGTIGTGSIAGVATAIVSGGPGAVFWMWVSALLGMITKYSEILLALKYQEKNCSEEWSGGPMYYLEKGVGLKWLSVIFSVFVIMASFGTGNATQGNAISSALESTLGVDPVVTAVILTVFVGAVILGGIKRIASVNEKLVPFMSVVYVLTAITALIVNADQLGVAFSLIFREAFNVRSVAGGIGGYGIFTALRYGSARGVFSNEAGLGSAPIAHAASAAKEPVEQAMWGVFEVFFTTIIICTCSALVILTSGALETGLSGASLGIAAYNRALPGIGGFAVALASVLFATSTILGWAYYGEKSVEYIFCRNISLANRKVPVTVYRIMYSIIVFIGAFGGSKSLDLIWQISDTTNGLMALPNLIGVLALSGIVAKTTLEYFMKRKET